MCGSIIPLNSKFYYDEYNYFSKYIIITNLNKF